MGLFGSSREDSPQDRVDTAALADLRARVVRLEDAVARLLAGGLPQAAYADGAVPSPVPPAVPVEPDWLGEVRRLKAQGQLIGAIKLYRERTGVGLKEAKDAVEAMP